MPKVSTEHLAARREQIVAAALTRFARGGFHATTMADVIEESGLSAGAVYRYFRGKDELVEAISERALGAGSQALAELLTRDEAPDLAEVVTVLVETLEDVTTNTPVDLRRVALQAWAEALRAPGVQRTASTAQQRVRHQLAQAVLRARDDGAVRADVDVDAAAQVLQALVVGRVVQQLVAGDVAVADYVRAVRALLAAAPPGPLPDGLLPGPAPAATATTERTTEPTTEPGPAGTGAVAAAGSRVRVAPGLGWPD